MPTQPKPSPTGYDRSFSLTSRPTPSTSILPHDHQSSSKQAFAPPPSQRSSVAIPTQRSSVVIPSHQPSTSISRGKSPIVYPALLSKVAEAFKSRTVLSERTKDGLTYTACFDGRAAVDKIAYIIKTTDRNLALLLGRALDAQKFFHDVTYDHRLRDSPNELYQFRARLGSPFTSLEDMRLPSGVFTLLTDCYSPTCTRDRLCYSIACPRRLEQQARLNLKPKPGLLKRSLSTESLIDLKEPGTLWIHSVPQEVIDSVDDTEKKRQEAINECIYTERDFVRDLEYLRDSWIKPLQTSSIIPEHRRQDFVTQVFWNVLDVLAVNSRLSELLSKRQKSSHVIKSIGDLYLELVPHFGPFVQYGSHQLYGKYEFEKEKISNLAFGKFVDETERLPESRKLELNAYLTKPTTRLARYPLLLEVVLKYTPDDHSDKIDLPKVIKMIRELLTKVNIESGKSENRFNLAQLDQQLVFRQGEAVDLRLREEGRELIFKGQLKKRGGGGSDSAELQVYLFDHALLMVKPKYSHKTEQLKVYRKPIPLELLTITGLVNQPNPNQADGHHQSTSLTKKSLMNRANKAGYPITINHLGRKGYSIVLWAPSFQSRSKWLEKIEARQIELRNRSTVFEMVALNEGFFVGNNKVTCAASFDNGNRYVFGTENGVYLSSMPNRSNLPPSSSTSLEEEGILKPIRVIQIMNVTQVEVIEPERILIILADKAMMSFWLDTLDPNDSTGIGKRTRKISSNATFFRTGECLGKKLVCVVKSGTVSSTIKTLEVLRGFGAPGQGKSGLRKIVGGNSNDALKVYKEFYIPTESSSVHFLKSKLCVGCNKGFEIVDLESLDTQALLDPADPSLEFVLRGGSVKPLGIFRVEGGGGEFLLCYEDFGFYVNKNGWRARNNWIVYWEGHPVAFAIQYPFVLAFEPSFVEVRHLETGALLQIIPGPNIRFVV
ncbi:uncharacterized protein MELLADRAFT_48159 [Melampsora larici-populina 98AG31]|uniref:Uncharacterized protein n=1 Tax=Melampsora larici-populina (strain 98AG31 / pathotype 3-4-7) TaxID=747676 RepID=F4RK51_MELLP|nr:uncharacterized protein MELLADRAFT_48159 [Melampsora larici-populina 98AG31]EGG07244.1 hypothetical protein MELLADRAFT_48159 [Melampsora larici-populina 98AG31]